ncbi:hypothetical protein [Acinetobacter larvae]|nr:hypothetical protein [Acinetobacter larvae]
MPIILNITFPQKVNFAYFLRTDTRKKTKTATYIAAAHTDKIPAF